MNQIEHSPDVETVRGATPLGVQYVAAVNLYMHEDSLNWLKLRTLITLLVLLGAGQSFFWKASPQSFEYLVPVSLGLWLMGTIIFTVLSITIWSGCKYMDSRKDMVTKIEGLLEAQGGVRIVSTHGSDPDKKFLKTSITVKILKWMPMLAIVGWTASIAALILVKI